MDNRWWEQIPGPQRLINELLEHILEERSILLALPEDVPWKESFSEMLEDKLSLQAFYRMVKETDCPDMSPAKYIFEHYCSESVQAEYRFNVTYEEYIAKQEPSLDLSCIWVHNIPKERLKGWTDFVTAYRKHLPRGRYPAVFILETTADTLPSVKKEIALIKYKDFIKPYDLHTFCALEAADADCEEALLPYLTELLFSISSNCPERVPELCQKSKELLQTPFELEINDTADPRVHSERTGKRKSHILESQAKFLFPLLEQYRSQFIEDHFEELTRHLPVKTVFGEEIGSAEELELGTIYYMQCSGLLDLPEEETNDLRNFRFARNCIAHRDVIALSVIEKIAKRIQ